jgi:hypothetical protein
MHIPPTLQNTFVIAFLIAWIGGSLMLALRYRAKQRTYLQNFPPVEGVPLDMYVVGGPRTVIRALVRALLQRQTDDNLEQQRREVWQRYRLLSAWSLGCPVVGFAIAVLVQYLGWTP